MELFSKEFERKVQNVIDDLNITVVATVPLKGGGPLIQKLKNNNSHHLITVSYYVQFIFIICIVKFLFR
jgi:nucleoside-triphosphatase THEP1